MQFHYHLYHQVPIKVHFQIKNQLKSISFIQFYYHYIFFVLLDPNNFLYLKLFLKHFDKNFLFIKKKGLLPQVLTCLILLRFLLLVK